MRLIGEKVNRINKIRSVSLFFIIVFSFFIVPLSSSLLNYNYKHPVEQSEFIHSSAETVHNQEWLSNNDLSTQGEWFYNQGTQGDNSTTDANINSGQANYIVVGDTNNFEITTGSINSSTWYGWGIYNNSDFLLPDDYAINATGCYVYHFLDESEGPTDEGQVHNFPSIHFRKNISLEDDMSEYEITSASLKTIFNATVDFDVDTPLDASNPEVSQFNIGDSATFYVEISDLNRTFSFRVAENKTKYLGQWSPTAAYPSILNITDSLLASINEVDLITALNLALQKDSTHSHFTITLGIDIYCEDNRGSPGDTDKWKALIFKSFNLTFGYERKVDQFSSISWNQIGNTISGSNIQVTEANLKFRYRIDKDWPTSSSPFSEIRIIINNNQHPETVQLSSATTLWQDAKLGGFDVTNLILKDINISISLQVFIANTFNLNNNITISIDDVYLNITYIETFADYGTESQLFLETINKTADPFIQVPLGNTVNITIKYVDNQTGNHVSGAIVQLSGKVLDQLNENGTLEQYSRIINSSDLEIGIWSLTVTAQKSNYETQIIPFFIDVVERPTDLELHVDGISKTSNNTVNIKYNVVMNITIFYQDNLTNKHLSGANVTITSFGDLTENNEQYTIIINSNSLNLGFNVLTITAQAENYTSQMIQFYIEVFERATEFELYVNDDQKANNDIIQIEVNQILNLTVFYRDDISKTHLGGAEASLLTVGNFSEIGTQYNYTLNSNKLNLGFNVLSVFTQLDNYESQSIQIYVDVYDIASELQILVNDTTTNALETIQVEVNQFVNITVFYRDNVTKLHISGAIVSLDWDNFTETGSQYYYNLNTSDLNQGITIVTIEAQFNNYQSQTIQFYFEVVERLTEMEVYVDNSQKMEAETILVDVNQKLNITVFYRDNVTKLHISNAIVTVLGGNFSETNNQYNYSLDTNSLEQGISILTIFTHLDNYQPQTFQFYIHVIERASQIQLFIDLEDKTNDPAVELPIGSNLNITIKYTDNQTGLHINGGNVQLTADGFSENLTESLILEQYTLILNTSTLKIGVNLFTILVHATNFQHKSINLRITVNKISTLINSTSGESYISLLIGENVMLSVVLKDLDFGGNIFDALVTYRWVYGNGTLLDDDHDGIYKTEIVNVPVGTYTITITAFAGDTYSFITYKITLNVVSESFPDYTLLFIGLAGGFVALLVGLTLYQTHFKYPPLVRKIRKIRKKINKDKKIKPTGSLSRELLVAKNLQNKIKLSEYKPTPIEKKIEK
ncbi:MAG: hypothetical protein ACTSV5_01785 [Promethearchaeota archaeon]